MFWPWLRDNQPRSGLTMHPQYDYTVVIGHDHRITSKVDYMVTKRDVYIVFVVEDKHPKGTSELTNWSEHQIAGEIFGSAYHNVDIGTYSSEVISFVYTRHPYYWHRVYIL